MSFPPDDVHVVDGDDVGERRDGHLLRGESRRVSPADGDGQLRRARHDGRGVVVADRDAAQLRRGVRDVRVRHRRL